MNAMTATPMASGPRSSSGSARSQQSRQVNVSRHPSLHRPEHLLPEDVRPQFSPRSSAREAQETLRVIKEPVTDMNRQQPDKQISQIEKSVTHLLVATKQLLETLTQWSRKTATEGEVSDVYVRLGYEFNLACRAFSAIGVETNDLGPVPDQLRAILEDTLSQEASPQSLDRFLPRIRDIIIGLLHGLKRKQAKLRSRQNKEGKPTTSAQPGRQTSVASAGSGDTGLTQMLEDAQQASSRPNARRYDSTSTTGEDQYGVVPPRSSSVQHPNQPPLERTGSAPGRESPRRAAQRSTTESTSSSSLSSTTLQNIPVLPPYSDDNVPAPSKSPPNAAASYPHPPPPPPPKQQDALAALQRGGDLERRASRRYSAYQIQKHLGASPNGVPVIPPPQNSPIPNRGRDARESMNAVRTRGSYQQHTRQRSNNRLQEVSPSRNQNLPHRISEESSEGSLITSTLKPPVEQPRDDSPTAKTPEDKFGPPILSTGDDRDLVGPTLTGPPSALDNSKVFFDANGDLDQEQSYEPEREVPRDRDDTRTKRKEDSGATITPPRSQQFTPDESPPPGKELTLFLQYKSKIKKYVLSEGYSDLSIGRLQLAFIEKFAWNTHSNGADLPEIYIQDPVSGIRHELEDLTDVKDRSVLVLNVEVLDEVKKHFDDGLGGVRRLIEGVRGVIDGQEVAIQRLSDRQLETAKDMARLAAAPPTPAVTVVSRSKSDTRSVSTIEPLESSSQLSEIQSLRRDLAVVRQTYSSFASDITASMNTIRSKAASVKSVAIKAAVPSLEGDAGRIHINTGKKSLGEESEKLVGRVDDLQDLIEDLRKDVVSRGVRPLPRQLETVGKNIAAVTKELKKMQEFLKREKPVWTKIWEKELQLVCEERDQLTMQEDLAADLEDDLDKANQTFALVEQATKQQLQTGIGQANLRSTSRQIAIDQDVDPMKAKDGVLGEVRALQPNHESRLEAIERAEKLRQKELESRQGGEFQKELGRFVENGKLKKSGGVEEVERLRKAKDERARQENFDRAAQRAAEREARKAEKERQKENNAEAGQQDGPAEESVDAPATSKNEATDSVPELPILPDLGLTLEPEHKEDEIAEEAKPVDKPTESVGM
jgi:hypothetical protein